MTRRIVTLMTLVVIPIGVVFSQWRENGRVVPNTPWSKSENGFGATLVFTDKPDELLAALEKPSPGVHLSETSTAVRGMPIVGVIYFTGCVANAAGNCELVARFTTKTPEGKLWGDPIGAELWVNLPPPGKDQLQLSKGNLGLVIDPGDSLGVYKVKAEILDRVSKNRMVLERDFTAVEAPAK